MVKNPVDRMYAVFRDMIFPKGQSKGSQAAAFDAWVRHRASGAALDPALGLRRPNCCWDVDMTCYTNLKLWLQHYPGQILLVPSRHLQNQTRRPALFNDILDFAGLTKEQAQDCGDTGCGDADVHRLGGVAGNKREPVWATTRRYLWQVGKFGEQLERVQGWLCGADDTPAAAHCRRWWLDAHACSSLPECG